MLKEVFRSTLLPAMTGIPKGMVDMIRPDTKTDTKIVKTSMLQLSRFKLIPKQNRAFLPVIGAKKGRLTLASTFK